ncbi:MAG TPA: WD40 repeat domain-containing protein, partial [Saprospiraceae bacterium]|nr:WD40 repeat domain-containing protein [Saprospiraceae bacterium]
MTRLFPCLLLLLALLLSPALHAQTDCEKLIREGKRLMGSKKYDDALNQFWAALVTCQNEPGGAQVSDLIRQAQEAYIRDLAAAVEREKKALGDALQAKAQAETAKQNEEVARRRAEENERRAREQGLRAESRRLALLADNTRARGQRSDALMLAYLALRLAQKQSPEGARPAEAAVPLLRAFGEAVRDSFGVTVFEGKTAAEGLLPAPDGGHLLVRGGDQSLHCIQLSTRRAVLLSPPGKEAANAAWSPQGDVVAVWVGNAPPRLLSPDGTQIAVLEGHSEAVRQVVFSADGQWIVTASRDNTARLWDRWGRGVLTLLGHTGNVYGVAFSADQRSVLTRSSDGTARLWRLDGEMIATIGSSSNYLHDVECSPTGHFVTAESDGSVRCWTAEGRPCEVLAQHEGVAREVLISPSGQVISRGNDRTVQLSRLGSRAAAAKLPHPAAVSGFALSTDGNSLITWADDHIVRLWNLNEARLVQAFTGHKGRVLQAILSPDSRYLLSSSKDGSAKLWDLAGNVQTE